MLYLVKAQCPDDCTSDELKDRCMDLEFNSFYPGTVDKIKMSIYIIMCTSDNVCIEKEFNGFISYLSSKAYKISEPKYKLSNECWKEYKQETVIS